jgi:hypothetical protein
MADIPFALNTLRSGITVMEKLCLICQKRKAIKIEPWGWMPCEVCRKKQREIARPNITGEITTDQIKEDRKIFKSDLTQPFRDGHLAREFVKAYPEKVKQMIDEGHITEEEVKKSKDVWDLDYYKND